MIGLRIGVVSFISTFCLNELAVVYLSQIYIDYRKDLVFALATTEVIFHILKWRFVFLILLHEMLLAIDEFLFLLFLLVNDFYYLIFSLINIAE